MPPTSPSTISSGYFNNHNDDENLINMIADRLNSISPPERKSLFKYKLQELVLETFSRSAITTTVKETTTRTAPPAPITASVTAAYRTTDGKEGIHHIIIDSQESFCTRDYY
ncbi:MAG: hypothetical protein ACXV2C_00680 [Candidatus Bathyarchaeia archaeon]